MRYLKFLLIVLLVSCSNERNISIVEGSASPRIKFGVEKLSKALTDKGYKVSVFSETPENNKDRVIMVSEGNDTSKKERFQIKTKGNTISIEGSDASGALYGTLALADRITQTGEMPSEINFQDGPEMVLRGTCIGLQKTAYLEGRDVYEYPYTPENFPWFYDRDLWIKYLDMMVENRYNSLYLWNGHPFASLVKLDDYPFALEVSEEDFKKNEDIFKFITEEADKRGIWVIQMFY
ncbi:MAG TPA: glycoside hydrolase family 20 zincin-like fold domain-containing protein, partial [Mariniflexile sp.]|nr:glycoside hydrolase family 20 zincin-like fold domain-containing protein [Mariniflexile sp.]